MRYRILVEVQLAAIHTQFRAYPGRKTRPGAPVTR